jgi:hypothetical protein
VLETWRSVDVESCLIVRFIGCGFVELPRFDPGLGSKTATSCSGDVDAANDVPQVSVTLWSIGDTVSFVHPRIGLPWFSNVIVPEGLTELELEVTVAISVTP